jgi:hypothetical protein
MRLREKEINPGGNGIRIVFSMSNYLLIIQIEYLKMLITSQRCLQASLSTIRHLILGFIKIINQTLDRIERVICRHQFSVIIKLIALLQCKKPLTFSQLKFKRKNIFLVQVWVKKLQLMDWIAKL